MIEAQLPTVKDIHKPISKIEKYKLNIRSFVVMVIAALCPYTFVAIGEMFYAELLIILFSLILLFTSDSNQIFQSKTFKNLLFFSFLTLLGYILSDLLQGTRPEQYLRGWGRVLFLLSDVFFIGIVVGRDKRLFWWFCLGYAIGQIVYSLVSGIGLEGWKIYYAVPTALLTLISVYWIGYKAAVLVLITLALFGLTLDSRSDPAMILLVASILFVRVKHKKKRISIKKVLSLLLIPITILTILGGLFFSLNQEKYSERQKASNYGRSLSFTLGIQSVIHSPIIGVGSWNNSIDIVKLKKEIITKELGTRAAVLSGDGFAPHSQILQSWYEGGILGAAFFLYFFYLLIVRFKEIVFLRSLDPYSGLLLYMYTYGAWHLFMSPFGGNHRMTIAMSVIIFVFKDIEKTDQKTYVKKKPEAWEVR